MKIFFDTEFTGLHQDTTLISIGLITEDNRTFYAELTDYSKEQCDDWIDKNVISTLLLNNSEKRRRMYIPNYYTGTKDDICKALEDWLFQFDTVELVSDVCHYDMVLFIDLFGGAFDIPKNVSPYCHDINQDIANYYKISDAEAFDKSREDILYSKYKDNVINGEKHNALYDAKVIKEVYQIVNSVDFK